MNYQQIEEIEKCVLNDRKRIGQVVFELDKIVIAVRFKNITTKEFIGIVNKKFSATSASWEIQTNSKAWSNEFNHRTYYDFGDNVILLVLTHKARALENIDALMVLFNPSPTAIITVHNFWKRLFKKFEIHMAGAEFAFDFLCKEKHCRRLQRLFRLFTYYSYGKVAFRKGKTTFTDYINSRKSVKQIRIYSKQESYSCVRVELWIKREKLRRIGIKTPIDILTHDPVFIDELYFYSLDFFHLSRSLVNFNTHGYFADQVIHLFHRKGFLRAYSWAKKIRICPNRCKHRDKIKCRKIIGKHDDQITGARRFKRIQECVYSRPVGHFRRDFGFEVRELSTIREKMKDAFDSWQNY